MLPAGNVGSFCEASIFVLQKRTGPKELEVYLRLLELTHHVPRVPGCGSSCLRDMFQVKRLPTYLTFVFGVSARNPWRAACPSPDCIDFVQCPSPPLPCRFVHCPMLPPLGSSPLHLRFGSSSARSRGSLHPGGRLHLHGAGLSSGSLSSATGGRSSGSWPVLLSSWFGSFSASGSRSSGPSLNASGALQAGLLRHRPCPFLPKGPLRLPCLREAGSIPSRGRKKPCFASVGPTAFAVGPCGFSVSSRPLLCSLQAGSVL